MSTLDSYQHNNNTTILCIWAWERCRPSVWKWLQKRLKKKKTVLNWYSNFHRQKLATTQDRQALKNSDERPYCQSCILRLVVFTRFPANTAWLLKLDMSIKSARTVSQRVYIGLTSYG